MKILAVILVILLMMPISYALLDEFIKKRRIKIRNRFAAILDMGRRFLF